jgi:hypothetical protein
MKTVIRAIADCFRSVPRLPHDVSSLRASVLTSPWSVL